MKFYSVFDGEKSRWFTKKREAISYAREILADVLIDEDGKEVIFQPKTEVVLVDIGKVNREKVLALLNHKGIVEVSKTVWPVSQ